MVQAPKLLVSPLRRMVTPGTDLATASGAAMTVDPFFNFAIVGADRCDFHADIVLHPAPKCSRRARRTRTKRDI